jgi:hypothetical protein
MDLVAIFEGAPFSWWIAGGYEAEMAARSTWRTHGDIDVLVLRSDEAAVHDKLQHWDCWIADGGELRRWIAPGRLSDAHDVWCRETANGPWRFQLMFDHSSEAFWVSRRNPRVQKPITQLAGTGSPIPYLSPEILLFYKAAFLRDKDEVDFAHLQPVLTGTQCEWLVGAIGMTYGEDHP